MDDLKIIRAIYQHYKKQTKETVIEKLKLLGDKDFPLSGNHSGLRNVWEEICVQVQDERSFYWDAYEDTIDNHIEVELQKLPNCIQNAISYYENIYEEGDEEFIFTNRVVIKAIRKDILKTADEFENTNIRRYLDREEDEEDENEEDKEDFEDEE